MIKKYYYCNLCGDEKKKEDLLCVHWNGTVKKLDGFGAYELITNIEATEKHLCKDCFKLIYEYVEKYKPAFVN